MELVGRILWFSKEDGFGIVRCVSGRSYEFKVGAVSPDSLTMLREGTFVHFKVRSVSSKAISKKSLRIIYELLGALGPGSLHPIVV